MRRDAGVVCALLLVAGGCDVDRPWPALEPSFERMLVQPRVNAYSSNDFFEDGASMRPRPAFAVAYGAGDLGEVRSKTLSPEDPAAQLDAVVEVPVHVDRALLELGRRRFQTICATCHGVLGDGRSPVADRMALRRPPSLHEDRIRAFSAGHLYGIVERGFGLMPAYESVLEEKERWAVVAYVEALELSRHASSSDVPPEVRAALDRSAP